MRLSRFIKSGFKGFERSCLWDLSPIPHWYWPASWNGLRRSWARRS